MSTYNLLKGHNLQLKGEPSLNIKNSKEGAYSAIHPISYKGMKPKLLIKEGDNVQIGQPCFTIRQKNP